MRTDPVVEPGDRDEPPFSNGTMGEIGLHNMCQEACIHDSTYGAPSENTLDTETHCPLITLSLLGVTPHEWSEEPGKEWAGPVVCSEFTTEVPSKPGPLAVDLFGVYQHEPSPGLYIPVNPGGIPVDETR